MKLKKSFKKYFYFIIHFSFIIFLNSCSSIKFIPGFEEQQNLDLYYEYYNLANEFFNLKNYDKALFYYKKCLDNSELYWNSYYQISLIHIYKSEWDLAIEKLNILLQRDFENTSIKETIAYCYAMKGNKDKAIELYVELIENNGEQSSYYENVISILINQKKIEDAEYYLNILKEKFPDSSNIELFSKKIDELKEGNEKTQNNTLTKD